MTFPEDLLYTKEHEWVRLTDDGEAYVGITDFAQHELGDIVFVELEDEGSSFDRDEVFGTIEAVKTVAELYMPVSGTITELNEELEDEPERVNDDPYGEGWMVKIKLADPGEVDDLLSPETYTEMVGAEG